MEVVCLPVVHLSGEKLTLEFRHTVHPKHLREQGRQEDTSTMKTNNGCMECLKLAGGTGIRWWSLRFLVQILMVSIGVGQDNS